MNISTATAVFCNIVVLCNGMVTRVEKPNKSKRPDSVVMDHTLVRSISH